MIELYRGGSGRETKGAGARGGKREGQWEREIHGKGCGKERIVDFFT
jgi:hypothetical protein